LFVVFQETAMPRTIGFLLCVTLFAGCGDGPAPAVNQAPDKPVAATNQHGHSHAAEKPEPGDMSHGGEDDFRWDHLAAPRPDHDLVDLKNTKDPVSLEPVGTVRAEYKGYLVHFESDATRARFERKPIKFLNMLSLEPGKDGSVSLVDASTYQDAVTEFCMFMPESEVDPHGTVYLLHRGWKFYFCCWTGCGDKFMQDPAAAYDWYGLVERDGKLVRKASD
jgi:YHS domain-containing protein